MAAYYSCRLIVTISLEIRKVLLLGVGFVVTADSCKFSRICLIILVYFVTHWFKLLWETRR